MSRFSSFGTFQSFNNIARTPAPATGAGVPIILKTCSLLVAGGGGGGSGYFFYGGGGGAGGLITCPYVTGCGCCYCVLIGAGGVGSCADLAGGNGGCTCVFGFCANGGGGGGTGAGCLCQAPTVFAQCGGSGGGAGYKPAGIQGCCFADPCACVQGGCAVPAGQGNAGGYGYWCCVVTPSPAFSSAAAGGGGAGGAGGDATPYQSGNGGPGLSTTIATGPGGPATTYAGGGGGAGGYFASTCCGLGGSGGGGAGAYNGGLGSPVYTNAVNGCPATGGGGGGGACWANPTQSCVLPGNGGGGIAIITYCCAFQAGSGGQQITCYSYGTQTNWAHYFTCSSKFCSAQPGFPCVTVCPNTTSICEGCVLTYTVTAGSYMAPGATVCWCDVGNTPAAVFSDNTTTGYLTLSGGVGTITRCGLPGNYIPGGCSCICIQVVDWSNQNCVFGTATPVLICYVPITVSYLVVGGGGSGGTVPANICVGAGGGGGGGFVCGTFPLTIGCSFTVCVGAGGAATPSSTNIPGNFGSCSCLTGPNVSASACGGGGGGANGLSGCCGGSGGGQGFGSPSPSCGGGSGTPGQGNCGGRSGSISTAPSGTTYGGGGGGGACTSGFIPCADPNSGRGGDGGCGCAWLDGKYYAGGGGGGAGNNGSLYGGTGGFGSANWQCHGGACTGCNLGGGGSGCGNNGSASPFGVATAYTGGGGGGGASGFPGCGTPAARGNGTAGASGVVLVAYCYCCQLGSQGTVTNPTACCFIHCFTATTTWIT